LEGQLDESRTKVSILEARCGEKCDETDKLRQEMDRLNQAHNVRRFMFLLLKSKCTGS